MESDRKRAVLLIDDDDVDREMVYRLVGTDFVLMEASTASEALELLSRAEPDCVLLDYRLPDADGLDLLGEFAERRIPTVMLTGQGSQSTAVEAMKRGAHDYLLKESLSRVDLQRAIQNSIVKMDLTRKIEEQRVRIVENERLLGEVMSGMPVGLFVADEKWGVTALNPAARELLGFVGREETNSIEALFSRDRVFRAGSDEPYPLSELPIQKALETGEVVRVDDLELAGEKGRHAVILSASPMFGEGPRKVIVTLQDITDERRLAHQVRMAQRMEAVGQLAGGVAHDFNNLLTAIYSYSTFVAGELEPGTAIYDDLQQIIKATKKAESLTRQLLAFSRRQTVRPKVLNINQVVQDLEKLLRRLLGESHNYRTRLADSLGNVRIDPGALEQILINLVVNAKDAMKKGGQVSIETANIDVAADYGPAHGVDIAPGRYIMVAVSDTGVGIDPKIQAQIFEPFFTTKEAGRGTGLGLATCYGLVKQANGHIWLYSELNLGTTFKILLPHVDSIADPAPSVSDDGRLSGTETILVAEDNDQVRKLTERVLRRFGYHVITASNGGEAVTMFEARPEIDLLVTDVIMPEMNGRELADVVTRSRPDLKVLFMSGYAPHAIVHHGVLEPGREFLQKPFTPSQLAQRVRQLLDDDGQPVEVT